MTNPMIIAHRGASGIRPENTLEAFRTAIRGGADAIELDLVPTRDGVLVARHECDLAPTTDVAERPELAEHRTSRPVGSQMVDSWFTQDLALWQIRHLTARERHPELRPLSAWHDGRDTVPTLTEVLSLVEDEASIRGREVGILLEIKQPAYFRRIGLPVIDPLLADLRRHGLDRADSPVRVLSFKTAFLQAVARQADVPVVQLLKRSAVIDAGAVREIAGYAAGIGAHRELVLPELDGLLGAPTDLVATAHAEGLGVHVWTLRAENKHLPIDLRHGAEPAGHGDLPGLAGMLVDEGVDGLITDHPHVLVEAFTASTVAA